MQHIGMRVYLTAIAMFVTSLLARSAVSRERESGPIPLPNSKHPLPLESCHTQD